MDIKGKSLIEIAKSFQPYRTNCVNIVKDAPYKRLNI